MDDGGFVGLKKNLFSANLTIFSLILLMIGKQADMNQQLMWMMYNAGKLQGHHTRQIKVNDEEIEISFGSYDEIENFPPLIQNWIKTKILPMWGVHGGREPAPMDCIYVYMEKEISTNKLSKLISLCLRLTFPPPSMISNPHGLYIENTVITLPGWEPLPTTMSSISQDIDCTILDQTIHLIERFMSKKETRFPVFNEVLKVAAIDDSLIETLCLWSFIEGFWNQKGDKSALEDSFDHMLATDVYPGERIKGSNIQILKRKIRSQNKVLGTDSISELRNIIAHGWYLDLERQWQQEQWDAIKEQRNLLLDTVLKALIERSLKESA